MFHVGGILLLSRLNIALPRIPCSLLCFSKQIDQIVDINRTFIRLT